jgi:hypothetical protein
MLLVVAPQVFSEASGTADLSVSLLGIGVIPDIDGTIEFSNETPLTITPRGIRREIALTGGQLKFTDQLVELEEVSGWVDDEGQLTDVTGEVSLEEWVPVDIDISVAARDLPFRIPQELELSLNVDGLRVVGGFDDGIEIEGRAEVVDGRYIRKFNPLLDALRPTRSTETSAPFYEGVPLLADAKLNLTLVSRAFFVKNNVANIELNGRVNITGTPADPAFDGVVRVEQGSFKFQGIRAKFERTQGTVTFSRLQKFPKDTPSLDLRSESDYRDISGQDHLVNLRLTGPISNLNWDLSTGAGLNKAQTLTLIFAGRTTEEARASLGDEPIGRRAGELSGTQSTSGSEGSLVIADQLIKDLAGDFFSLLIEDPIRNVTKLDVARLELGTSSIGFRGEKKLTKSLRAIGDFERTLRGWTWDVRSEYRLTDRFSIDGEVRQRNFDDDAQEDDSQWRLKASYRWVLIP